MKQTVRSWLVRVVVVWLCLAGWVSGADRTAAWKDVDEAMRKGQPQTAAQKLGAIAEGALADQAWAEFAKATLLRIAQESAVEGGKPEEAIARLNAALPKAPALVQPVYETVLGLSYWTYLQQNRWRIHQRTTVAGESGDDLRAWDLQRLLLETDRHLQRALESAALLQKIKADEFQLLLSQGTLPAACRPTLYDILAHEALRFYSAVDQGVTRPEDAFEVTADSPALGSMEEFLAWKPGAGQKTEETPAPLLRAVEILQALLRLHSAEPGSAALAEADFDRLQWAANVSVGPEKNERYEKALAAFADRWGDFEVSARALHRLAVRRQQHGQPAEAHQLASRGAKAHPDTPGGNACHNLVLQIETPELRVQAETVWAAPWPKLGVSYRNITNVHVKVIPADWEAIATRKVKAPGELAGNARAEFLKTRPVREWDAALPPTLDYKQRFEQVPVPEDLEPGYYHVVASVHPEPLAPPGIVASESFWVSDLALVLRQIPGRVEGFVLENGPGTPVVGAKVEVWDLQRPAGGSPGALRLATTVETDADGFFVVPGAESGVGESLQLRARSHNQTVASASVHRGEPNPKPEPSEGALVFTDRGLYRPGQTIHFKVLCLATDPGRPGKVLSDRDVTVTLHDPNGEPVSSMKLRSNDYGSCAGALNAPRDRVAGSYSLAASLREGDTAGTARLQVEEYKRPKFEVTLSAPGEAPRLDGEVRVAGRASAYAGAAIDGAKVGYRVVRTVRFQPWLRGGWGGHPGSGPGQEIARGTTRTAADGSFKVEFTARPDRAVPATDEPTFDFQVTADVTDGAGETRSASRMVRVGYTALEADLDVDEWVSTAEPLVVKVRTSSLDGEPQVAEGVLRLHAVRQPERVVRNTLTLHVDTDGAGQNPFPAGASPAGDWSLGQVVAERSFTTDTNGVATCTLGTVAGPFRLVLETQDRFGRKVTARRDMVSVDPDADTFSVRVPQRVMAPRWSVEPGGIFKVLWGTGYEEARAFIEVVRDGKPLQRGWTSPGRTQEWIRQAVTEELRGGFQVWVTLVRENRAYVTQRSVTVPWTNKRLDLAWEHVRSKLEPGGKETWSLKISQRPGTEGEDARQATAAAAELLATMYDASLDQFLALDWPTGIWQGAGDSSVLWTWMVNQQNDLDPLFSFRQPGYKQSHAVHRALAQEFSMAMFRAGRVPGARARAEAADLPTDMMMERYGVAMPAPMASLEASAVMKGALAELPALSSMIAGEGGAVAPGAPASVPAPPPRRDLRETAFFLPQLRCDSNGVVKLEFTMPEALTTWRFLALAHDRELRSGILEAKAVSAKDLMVQPNPPRFLREGDQLEFTVKVVNQLDRAARGAVRLHFFQAVDESPADRALGVERPEQSFDIPARESRSFSWRIRVPDGQGFLVYRASATAGRLTDGEEGAVPVLSRRVFVTESMPLAVRGPGTNRYEFKALAASGASKTLRHQGLTVQMVSNPAWYAVLALPFLMEFPHECSEQTFNRLYANALARSIANSQPRIRQVFNQWTNTPALDSPLEKNQDLKAVLLEETPWLRQAKGESQARRQVGLLFEDARLTAELNRAKSRLVEMQRSEGAWPWFPGGPASEYLTLYIATGFGRLRHLGVDIGVEPAIQALTYLDQETRERVARIRQQANADEHVPSSTEALYLYGRSFFLQDRPLPGPAASATEFLLRQARRYWTQLGCRQSQAHLALALKRWGGDENLAAAADIVKSLKERSVTDPELGRYWRDTELSWWWFHAPIETQALMIEVFDEVGADRAAVEECRVWLLKQKQVQAWKTTKATADAVYALLLRGGDWLASTNLVRVELGGVDITPGRGGAGQPGGGGLAARVEPGTGMYEHRVEGARVSPNMARVVVGKSDAGLAWGGVHWQYLEDVDKVPAHTATPLKLTKALFLKKATAAGPQLERLNGPAAVGDELVCRVELRVDRDMEYVHLKDQRGSGVEPVNVLSGYRFQDGLGYYESTRDTASHFFIDYLPKGTYVFEYACRVQHRGVYPSGIAEIQCMYAPEFNSHSASIPIEVR